MKLFLAITILLLASLTSRAQRFVRSIDNIAQLVASNPNQVHTNVWVNGYHAINDEGGGGFVWSVGSAASTNRGISFASTYPGAPAGRWTREVTAEPLSARWFGARGDGSTDDTAALQAWLDYASASARSRILLPHGIYQITSTLSISNLLGLKWTGAGISNTTIRVSGAISGPAIKLWNLQGADISDFRLDIQSGTATQGILIDTDLSPPSSLNKLQRLSIVAPGADVGLQLASSLTDNFQVDFTLAENCIFSQAATNVLIKSSNALENNFLNCLFTGFGANVPDYSLYIDNGSARVLSSGFTFAGLHDIYLGIGAGLYVSGGYSESTNILDVAFLATDPRPVQFDNFEHRRLNTNGTPVINWNRAGTLTLNGCTIGGGVYLGYLTNGVALNTVWTQGTNGFYGSSDALTRLTVNTPTNNWGFGTPLPYHKLDILGSIRLQDAHKLWFGGATNTTANLANLYWDSIDLLRSDDTIRAPIFTPDLVNVFQTGVTNDITTPALGLGNNKMISWPGSGGSYTNGGFADYSPLNQLRLGANNTTHLYISNRLVSIPLTFDLAVTNIGASQLVRADADYKLASVTVASPLTFDGTTLAIAGALINPTDTFVPYRSNSTTFADSQLSRNSASQLGFNYRAADEFGGNFSFLKQGRTGSATNSPASGAQLGVFGAGGWRGDIDVVGQQIQFIATENWSPTATGNRIEFRTIDNTTLTQDLRFTIDENGQVVFAPAAAPTTTSAGGVAFDNNAWAASRGTLQLFDGTADTYIVAALVSDPPSNGEVPMWNTGGTITWETIGGGAGATNAITSINSLTNVSQTLVTGTDGTDFNIGSTNSTHTFNLPFASAGSHGKLSSTNWTTFNDKAGSVSNLGGGFELSSGVSAGVLNLNTLTNGPATSSGITVSSNANRLDIALNINSLTTAVPDPTADKLAFYDASAATNRAALINSLYGAPGFINTYHTKSLLDATCTDFITIDVPANQTGASGYLEGHCIITKAGSTCIKNFSMAIGVARQDTFGGVTIHTAIVPSSGSENVFLSSTFSDIVFDDCGGTFSGATTAVIQISADALGDVPSAMSIGCNLRMQGPVNVSFP